MRKRLKEKVLKKKWHHVTWERLQKQVYELPTISHVVKVVAELYKVNESAIYQSRRGDRNEVRGVAMYVSQTFGDHSLGEIAEHFGLGHMSSVSQRVKRLQLELQEDRALRKRVKMLYQHLTP